MHARADLDEARQGDESRAVELALGVEAAERRGAVGVEQAVGSYHVPGGVVADDQVLAPRIVAIRVEAALGRLDRRVQLVGEHAPAEPLRGTHLGRVAGEAGGEPRARLVITKLVVSFRHGDIVGIPVAHFYGGYGDNVTSRSPFSETCRPQMDRGPHSVSAALRGVGGAESVVLIECPDPSSGTLPRDDARMTRRRMLAPGRS